MLEASRKLMDYVEGSRAAVAFTGAGISTECGIPDFRSKDSAWARHPPMPLGEFLASEHNRAEAWRRKFAMDDVYRGARPGKAHRAIARLVAENRMLGVVTQNIDGLHLASGVPAEKIAELHGNGGYAVCLSCERRHELDQVRASFEATSTAPRCACGGIVKSATVSFGQSMPAAAMALARSLVQRCDLMIVAGSSLVVFPAAGFPLLAVRNGARLAIVNREPTPLDDAADLVLRGDIGEIFGPLA